MSSNLTRVLAHHALTCPHIASSHIACSHLVHVCLNIATSHCAPRVPVSRTAHLACPYHATSKLAHPMWISSLLASSTKLTNLTRTCPQASLPMRSLATTRPHQRATSPICNLLHVQPYPLATLPTRDLTKARPRPLATSSRAHSLHSAPNQPNSEAHCKFQLDTVHLKLGGQGYIDKLTEL